MSKIWRIKSEQEFKAQNLWDNVKNIPVGWNSEGNMNYLFGKPIKPEHFEGCTSKKNINIDGWRIKPEEYIYAEQINAAIVPVAIQMPTSPGSGSEDPKFDLPRLAKEIDTMFQTQLKEVKSVQSKSTTEYAQFIKNSYDNYVAKVNQIFPEIKDQLLAEIQRGHTTIVLPDLREIPIQETDHPKMKDVLVSIQTQGKVMLVGPAGTGKTYMVAQIAERLNLPFYKYSCSRDSSVHDLIGYKQPASETYLETVFLKAYEFGGIFLVDKLFVQIY